MEETICPDTFPNTGPIELRIENVSAYDFNDVLVDTGGGQHEYCDVLSGAKSEYKRFESAYRYAFVEVMIDGSIFTLQPIDYVGESLLDDGKYTYVIDANDELEQFGRLSLSLTDD